MKEIFYSLYVQRNGKIRYHALLICAEFISGMRATCNQSEVHQICCRAEVIQENVLFGFMHHEEHRTEYGRDDCRSRISLNNHVTEFVGDTTTSVIQS